MINAVIPMVENAISVSRTNSDRVLRRAIVEMEINDIVAIESVRLARRLKGLSEMMRAHRRGRPSADHEASELRLIQRAAEAPKRRRRGRTL